VLRLVRQSASGSHALNTASTDDVYVNGYVTFVAPRVAGQVALRLPTNYKVQMIPSGCCGMAGSFGYEAEHFDISMTIAGLVLLPAVRSASADTIIAAPGTSCRHQIKDATGRIAHHPGRNSARRDSEVKPGCKAKMIRQRER
jgi:Fe-S oxidoreductase